MTTSLPIVERELRVAARKWSTFWVRIIAALVGIVIAGGFMLLNLIASQLGQGGPQIGQILFAVLTWISLGAALSAGVFFTSDCLSEEKREGTLGFLFLTDLKGYDVVFGKLFVTSLRGFFALLALFPVLAITFMLGGVTGMVFWKTMLALVNAMFFSLAAGMFVSAISRDSQRALIGTVLFMVLLIFGGPVADSVITEMGGRSFEPMFTLSSPGFVFVAVSDFRSTDFWHGLLTTQVIAWLFLCGACVLVPRTWQERKRASKSGDQGLDYTLKFGGKKFRAALRQKLITPNPIVWLACRERWQGMVMWTVAIMALFLTIFTFAIDWPTASRVAGYLIGSLLSMVVYLWVASQSCRFLVDARKSGLIELLLASPLKEEQIVSGQWAGLRGMFGVPLLIYFIAQLSSTLYGELALGSGMFAGIQDDLFEKILAVVSTVLGTAVIFANVIALAWFGMWMGLTSKNTNFATLKTILFVQVIPYMAISFISMLGISLLVMLITINSNGGMGILATGVGNWLPALYTLVPLVLALSKDIAFSLWARRKLHSSFRERATQAVMPVRIATLPPVMPKK